LDLFYVDPDKCKRDGHCVDECPAKIIKLEPQGVPEPTPDAEELCIYCGHCVAVCPHGALSHRSMGREQCPPIRKELGLSEEQVGQFLRSRRSIRTYLTRPVERDLLRRLIDTASFAPSGHNTQPVQWLVIHDSREVQRLAGIVVEWMNHLVGAKDPLAATLHMDRVVSAWDAGVDRVCRGAPHVIVAHAETNERTAQAACTIALTYLELAAFSFGLGGCWAGYFNTAANMWPPMGKALSLPKGHSAFGAMMIGYPKHRYHSVPLRKAPRVIWR
jgi:nitroreductase/NAD-dependent dihydropyrimidine dehydrogenase PreA subunit